MKKIYWKPRGISRAALALVSIISLISLFSVETLLTKKRQPYYKAKMKASQLASQAMQTIKDVRDATIEENEQSAVTTQPKVTSMTKISPSDEEADPAQTGMIGLLTSPVTSDSASLSAKQTSVNPNFAAAIVQMLKKAGMKDGDLVAVGCTGSFPALNICTYAAINTLNLKPVIISSAASSQWGANDPEFLWLDMEKVLYERDVFPYRSVAASLGGVEDKAIGISNLGKRKLTDGIKRNAIRMINSKDYLNSIEQRMSIYQEHAGDLPIKAYINVGGGTVSVGTRWGKRTFEPGLNLRKPTGGRYYDSVMTRFIDDGIPVIHLAGIERLAIKYGLPLQPASLPIPGEGEIFYRAEYNKWLAGSVLLIIVISMYVLIRSGLGHRLIQTKSTDKDKLFHEPTV